MKFFLIAFLFVTNAFAANICSYSETWEFIEALEEQNIYPHKKSQNHKKFSFVEKQMIHLMVIQQGWLSGSSRDEALEIFGDYYNGKIGSNSGEILYYAIKGREYALVHYWPGDNEVGAFFEMKNSAYKLVATIGDSFIDCK